MDNWKKNLNFLFNRLFRKHGLKSFLMPRKEFLEKSRRLFLEKFEEQFPDAYIHKSRHTLRYSFASALTLLTMSGGAMVYANQTNVSPDHPLYIFKRAGESIQLQLAPKDQKPLLNSEFAQRRASEIEEITTKDENAEKASVEKLNNDFNNQLGKAFDKFKEADQDGDIDQSDVAKFCQSISKAITAHAEAVSNYPQYSDDSKATALFDATCKKTDDSSKVKKYTSSEDKGSRTSKKNDSEKTSKGEKE